MFIKRYEEFSLLKRYDFIYERSENNHSTFYAYFTKKRVGEKTKGVPLYRGMVPKTFQRKNRSWNMYIGYERFCWSWKKELEENLKFELEENRYHGFFPSESFSA